MERRAHVSGFARAHRIARGELGIGADGESHGGSGECEGPGRGAAGVGRDRANQHIDTGTDGDADAVERQQR